MISQSHKFLFVDIVKTAGTSICKVLESYGGQGKHHAVCRQLPDLKKNRALQAIPNEQVLNDYFSFTFVRNPFDRLISLYGFCQKAPIQKKFNNKRWDALSTTSHRPLPPFEKGRITYWPTEFDVFVEWLVEHEKYYNDFTGEKYIPMKDWIVDAQGLPRVSFVGRFEKIQEDFDFVMKKITGETHALPIKNESMDHYKRLAAETIYNNKALEAMIQQYYQVDFECFNYSSLFEASEAYRLLKLG